MATSMSVSAHRLSVWVYFDDVTKHVYEDENVKVFLCPHLVVQNKTNKVIYVDKGSSFMYINGKATNMYSASSKTSGTTYTTGTAVNPGAIAYALGARGPVVAAMSATTYSSSSSNTYGTITHEKRFIPIAPESSEVIKNIYPYPSTVGGGNLKHYRLEEQGKKIKFTKGLSRQYTEENSVMKYKCLVRYSFSEDTNGQREATVDNYLKAFVVDKRKADRGEVPGQTLVRKAEDGYQFGSVWGLVGVTVGLSLAGVGAIAGILLAIL